MKTKEQEMEEELAYKKEDIKNSKVGFSYEEQEKFRCELILLQTELKGFQQGKAEGYKEGIKQNAEVMKKQWQDEAREEELDFLNKLNEAYLMARSKISWSESVINLIRKRISKLHGEKK